MANGVGTAEARRLGLDFGNQIFEQTRRRFANQFATQRNQSRSRFASRGAIGSSAAAAAERDIRAAEIAALQDASLNAQLAGTQLGQQEASRLEGIRQFNQRLGFNREQLAQTGALTREGFQNAIQLANIRGDQQLALLRLQQEMEKRRERNRLLGGIFGSAGQIATSFLPVPGA